MSVGMLKTAKFKDIEDELIMPAEPDWKTRTFIFDSDGQDIDSNITINIMHWSGETFTFSDVHWRDKVKAVKKRIRKPKKTSSLEIDYKKSICFYIALCVVKRFQLRKEEKVFFT